METRFYTSIEESRRLLELGLSADTADMHTELTEEDGELISVVTVGSGDRTKYNYGTPIWSVGALLEVMPKTIDESNETLHLDIYPATEGWFYEYGKDWENDYSVLMGGKTQIEAAYNMVCYLLTNNHIKKG